MELAIASLPKNGAEAPNKGTSMSPQDKAAPTDEQILAAARAMNKLAAEACGVDEADHWALYGNSQIIDAGVILRAALASTQQAEPLTMPCICEFPDPAKCGAPCERQLASPQRTEQFKAGYKAALNDVKTAQRAEFPIVSRWTVATHEADKQRESEDEREAFEAWVIREAGADAAKRWLGTDGYENLRIQDNRVGWAACLDWMAGRASAQAVPADRVRECAARLVEHADFKLGGVLSADSKAKEIPSGAVSQVKSRHLAALRDALAAAPKGD
ncbi:hypothetical protein [Flavobacterium sp.]|uniref:hypothetical protein n=1 Tax=Flavobacterium sp. TaxID=239 RepID=UPI0037C0F256